MAIWQRWRQYLTILLLLAGVCVLGIKYAPAADNALPNQHCPVEPDRPAKEKFCVSYRGKKVYFCCSSCVSMFQENPGEFLAALPQFSAEEVATARAEEKRSYARAKEAAEQPPVEERPTLSLKEIGEGTLQVIYNHQPLLYYFAMVLALYVLLNRLDKGRAPVAEPRKPSRAWQMVRSFGSPAILIVLVQFGLLVELAWPSVAPYLGAGVSSTAPNRLTNVGEADYTMAAQFQQDMLQEAVIEAQAKVPPRIRATYYRGNDERTPKLFNGGDYRTATFHLSLRTEEGRDLNPGDLITGHEVFLRLEIERAPFTADGFFVPSAMAKVCMVGGKPPPYSETGAVGGLVMLSIIKPNWRWEALYPIGAAGNKPVQVIQGIAYLCRAGKHSSRLIAQSVHYGIHYRLVLNRGRIDPKSLLYMAPLFFTNRDLANWFNHEPIPVLPRKNTDDPVLLGLDKYKTEQEQAEKKR